jgi:hypothetical protein
MKWIIVLLSALALALAGVASVAGTSVALAGDGLIADGIEQLTDTSPVVQLHGFSSLAGMALALVAFVLSVIGAARRRQWDWVIVLFFVLPIGYFGWYVLTVEGALGPGMLALLLPAATLFYGLRGLQGAFRLIDV